MLVLVVEDDPSTRDAVVAMLEELDVTEIETANDGEQALKMLEHRKFGTLLLDLMMPKVDGYEVLRALRSGTHIRPDRVIVMSAHILPAELDGLMELGADALMPKPFSMSTLEKLIS